MINITSFTADKQKITQGDPVLFSWKTEEAFRLSLMGDKETTNRYLDVKTNSIVLYPQSSDVYRLWATTAQGGGVQREITINVLPVVKADFTVEPMGGIAPLKVVLTNKSIGVMSVHVRWGDGLNGYYIPLNKTEFEYVYPNKGQYDIRVVAQSPDGRMDTKYQTIIVKDAVSKPELPKLNVDFTISPVDGMSPLTVTLKNISNGKTSYWYDWGDGESGLLTKDMLEHTYNNPGNYEVRLSAIDASGEKIWKNAFITVTEPKPMINSFSVDKQTVTECDSIAFTWDVTNADFLELSYESKDGRRAQEVTNAGGGVNVVPISAVYTLFARKGNDIVNANISITVLPKVVDQPKVVGQPKPFGVRNNIVTFAIIALIVLGLLPKEKK